MKVSPTKGSLSPLIPPPGCTRPQRNTRVAPASLALDGDLEFHPSAGNFKVPRAWEVKGSVGSKGLSRMGPLTEEGTSQSPSVAKGRESTHPGCEPQRARVHSADHSSPELQHCTAGIKQCRQPPGGAASGTDKQTQFILGQPQRLGVFSPHGMRSSEG